MPKTITPKKPLDRSSLNDKSNDETSGSNMNITKFDIEGPMLIEPRLFKDDRGYFYESFRADKFNEAAGETVDFVQDNQSFSAPKGTVRGLHYQSNPFAQGKLVRCLSGSIIDIIVDVREGSPTYGQHLRVELTGENHQQFFVPAGFLHGFATQEPDTLVAYKVTNYYSSECDGNVLWNSPSLGLDWGISDDEAVLSAKDAIAPDFVSWTTPFKA